VYLGQGLIGSSYERKATPVRWAAFIWDTKAERSGLNGSASIPVAHEFRQTTQERQQNGGIRVTAINANIS
jgi:prephenate dehydrogenase